MIRNSHNWAALGRALWVFSNPLQLVCNVLRRTAPASIRLRTPIGSVRLRMRNFESLKTAFSIFCREDYRVDGEKPLHFIDVGANIGISAAYFLTRNSCNTVHSYEPDSGNIGFLRANLAQFGARARIENKAVGATRAPLLLYRSSDGKYSSTLPNARAIAVESIAVEAFVDVLDTARSCGRPCVVKLDVEGLERELVSAIDFADHPNVERLFCESTDCGELIRRRHVRSLRNGYVEDLRFVPVGP